MKYSILLKKIIKIVILLIGAIILEQFLTMLLILKILPPLTKLGLTSEYHIMFFILTLGVPIFLAIIIFGLLGGLWIGGKIMNGFVISLIYYLYWFTVTMVMHGLKFDYITFLLLIGLLLIPTIGTLTYGVFTKYSRTSLSVTTKKEA